MRSGILWGRESRGVGKLSELATSVKIAKYHRSFYPQEGVKFDENKSLNRNQTHLICSFNAVL